ncbi:galactosyl transferase GMA12/MNN10 family-domain-containing protein [Hyaloraphidium curvatum]|nr:galactosyl transferase GMA12/MNN10 family-domain-containing protein [Hyaloraphidium curvatum]
MRLHVTPRKLVAGVFLPALVVWSLRAAGPMPDQSVVAVMALSPHRCLTPNGEEQKLRSVRARADYARLHGYGFRADGDINPQVKEHWNKVAVLHRAMRLHPNAEWLFFADLDAMVVNVRVPLPLGRYPRSVDLVVAGNASAVFGPAPDPRQSINSGVLLLRNTPWMRGFLDRQLEIARAFVTDPHGPLASEVRGFFGARYDFWIQDQTALIYILSHMPVEDRRRVHFEDMLFNSPDMWLRTWKPPGYVRTNASFSVVHFTGCQFCGRQAKEFTPEECFKVWDRAWDRHERDVRAEEDERLARRGATTWLDGLAGGGKVA